MVEQFNREYRENHKKCRDFGGALRMWLATLHSLFLNLEKYTLDCRDATAKRSAYGRGKIPAARLEGKPTLQPTVKV